MSVRDLPVATMERLTQFCHDRVILLPRGPRGPRGSAALLVLVLVIGFVIASLVMIMSQSADTATATVQRTVLASVARSAARSAISDVASQVQEAMNESRYNVVDRLACLDRTYQARISDHVAFSGFYVKNPGNVEVVVTPLEVDDETYEPYGLFQLSVTIEVFDDLGIEARRTVVEARGFRPHPDTDVLGMDALVRVDPTPAWRRSLP